MLIFDQLKKDDPQLRFLAVVVLSGLLVLLTGLWWVQLVSTKYFQQRLENQSTRTVRIPAIRGRILDHLGRPLAESRPVYSVDLYLDQLSQSYQKAYDTAAARYQAAFNSRIAAEEKQLRRHLTTDEKKKLNLVMTDPLRNWLHQQTRYEVTSNLLNGLSARLHEPVSLTQSNFEKWYERSRVLPLPVLANLNPRQVASFAEQSATVPGVDMEVESVRFYPGGSTAAHLLGYLTHDDESKDYRPYNYRLPDFTGASGIEHLYDEQLHGTPGERTVVINNYGFRQTESVETPPAPGDNVVLTIDLDVQKAAESALATAVAKAGFDHHGAVVVMDVRNGDVLAMASVPTYNPNHFVQRPDPAIWEKEYERWTNNDLQVEMNHAAQGLYAPGSIFKIIVGLAGLENGTLDPKEIVTSPGYWPMHGHDMRDTAPAGEYDFIRALALSCNYYFITNGLKPGVLPKMIALGQRLHFGERTGLLPRFEDRGYFPKLSDTRSSDWHLGNTANMSIGQDRLAVTPLQIAVMISAIANGGTVYYPRIVSRIESYDSDQVIESFPNHRVRDNLDVSPKSLAVVHEAMRADVERGRGQSTGYEAYVPGMVIYGKTGTAQVQKGKSVDKTLQITWFGSFASMSSNEPPKYAVVAMLAGGASGGGTCAPIAKEVYLALQQMEKKAAKPPAFAQTK